MNRTLPLLFVLAGCWSVKTPEMKAAAELEAANDPRAEAAWFDAIDDDDMTAQEHELARHRACKLLMDRLRPEIEAMQRVTPEQATALHAELGKCNEAADLQGRVAALEEMDANEAIDAIRATDAPDHEKLADAMPLLGKARRGNPHREWFRDTRDAKRTAVLEVADATTAPVTRAWLESLAVRFGHAPKTSLDDAAAERLAVHPASVQWTKDEACADLLPEPTFTKESDAGVPIEIEVAASNCTTNVTVGAWEEQYEYTWYTTEWQDQEQCTTTTIETVTPITNVLCYTSIQAGGTVCNEVGYTSKTETDTSTSCWTERVQVQIPHSEMRTRTVERAVRHVQFTATTTVRTAEGEDTSTRSVTDSHPGLKALKDAAEAPTTTKAFGASGKTTQNAVLESATALARKWRGETARQRSEDRTDPARAREDLLVAVAAGVTPTDEEWDFAFEPLGLSGAPRHSFRTGPKLQIPSPYRPYRPLLRYDRPYRGLTIAHTGYPTFLLSIGARGWDTEDLVSQPKRRGIAGVVNTRAMYSITTGQETKQGFGFHGFTDISLDVGARASEAWDFPNSDAAEFPMTLGVDLQFGAMIGGRSDRIAIFAGMAPMSSRQIIGGQTSRGLAFPWVAYAELRPVMRYPIFLTAWGYGVRTNRSTVRGARVDFPIARGIWFTPRIDERTLGTVIHGLDPEDPVDAGYRTLQSVSAGVTFTL